MTDPEPHTTRLALQRDPSRAPSRRTVLRVAATGALGAAVALTAGRRPRPIHAGESTFPAEVQQALDAILARATAPGTNPGVIAGAWVGERSWTRAVGVGDLATGTPIRLDDRVRIASITKTFVATIVLQLVDEGRLSLDDRLDHFVPEIANGARITIRQLLNMTAGVFNYVEDPDFLAAYEADPLLPFSPQDALAILRRHAPYFAPGERFHYSDSQYILLGLIVEQLTSEPLPATVARRVLTPLGLEATSFPTTPALPAPFARGYLGAGDGLRDITASNPDVAWAAGAMVSTLGDLRHWAEALARGTLLRPATRRDQQRWVTIVETPIVWRYGLGVFSVQGFIGHNGGIVGYSSWMGHLPEAEATVVVLVNRGGTEGGDADVIAPRIAATLLPDRFPIG